MKIKHTFLLLALGASICLSFFATEKTMATGTSTDTTVPLFDDEHPSTVYCGDIAWEKTVYKNDSGEIVGTFLIEGGIVKSSYTGSYVTKTTSSGSVAGHNATMMECYDWGWGCTSKSATEACQ